jgi:hypothetical protein
VLATIASTCVSLGVCLLHSESMFGTPSTWQNYGLLGTGTRGPWLLLGTIPFSYLQDLLILIFLVVELRAMHWWGSALSLEPCTWHISGPHAHWKNSAWASRLGTAARVPTIAQKSCSIRKSLSLLREESWQNPICLYDPSSSVLPQLLSFRKNTHLKGVPTS